MVLERPYVTDRVFAALALHSLNKCSSPHEPIEQISSEEKKTCITKEKQRLKLPNFDTEL